MLFTEKMKATEQDVYNPLVNKYSVVGRNISKEAYGFHG